jgi:tRNA pseudouridine32 synthase/23S rRNA pseudouridine746 synthase
VTEKFTNPFRYTPHPLVKVAAEVVISDLDRRISEGLLPDKVCRGFKEGKMMGVLVCKSKEDGSEPVYLAGFSGSVGGCSIIEGFVPPIFDLNDPDGYYKQKEAEITDFNEFITDLKNASEYHDYWRMLWRAEAEREADLMVMRERMAASKKERDRRRAEGCDEAVLIKESQFEKAELKRLKLSYEAKIKDIKDNLQGFKDNIDKYMQERAALSDALQQWIFKNYKVHNARGEEASIHEIFASQGLTPQGGTGDCAAPKLLEHAYKQGLKPLAMGEFWYGTSPDTAVRTHGHFYPSCTSKCGPLLGYMLKGLELESGTTDDDHCPVVIRKDDTIIAISKPSGMPSVPGLDGKVSAQEWLEKKFGSGAIHPVHRLDMDTSGVMLFARTAEAAAELRKQFEEHSISKTYVARLAPQTEWSYNLHQDRGKGTIKLPLSADYDERPRQKVDKNQGKEAITHYEIVSKNPDGTIDMKFYPVTGRTHQLRVHSAHNLGLRTPILGDMLYGGQSSAVPDINGDTFTLCPERLHLHALSITFRHPVSGRQTTIESDVNIYQDLPPIRTCRPL